MSRQAVVNLLRGKTARRIRFTFDSSGSTLTVDSLAFNTVADAINAGRVTVTVSTAIVGAGATYSSGTNTITMPPMTGRWEEMATLHECTHTFFDLAKTAISAVAEEAAAYVVGALYLRMTGLTPSRWSPITLQARSLTTGLLRHYARGAAGIPAVDAKLWAALCMTIMTNPIYLDGPAGLGAQVLPFVSDSYSNDG